MPARSSPATWRDALLVVVATDAARWAVTGSAALALHGMTVTPRDLDLIATESGADQLVHALANFVTGDDRVYERDLLRADRRIACAVQGVQVEILVNARNTGAATETSPIDIDAETEWIDGASVVTLANLLQVYVSMGRGETAAAIAARLQLNP